MKYTLITTVLLSVLLAPVWGASADPNRDRAEARQDRRDVREDRRAIRDDAGDLDVLRDIQVELARARVESNAQAVAALDARVMEMLRDEQAEGARESSRARREVRRGGREVRGDRRETRENRRKGASPADRADDRHDLRDDRRDRRDDRHDAADEHRQNEARARVAAEWAQLDGRYEREDLERRVVLLDQLVDIARAESHENERERREDRREIREDRRDGREGRRER